MATKIKKIERSEDLTLLEKIYLIEIIRGVYITSVHFFENLLNLISEFILRRGRKKRSIMTVMYPEETITPPAAYRGRPLLVRGKNGRELCVACGLCEVACPPRCISIKGGTREDNSSYPETYQLDGGVCIFCGRCEEVCPKRAIVMSDDWSGISSYDRAKMIYQKEDLLRDISDLKRRFIFIQSNPFASERYIDNKG